MSFATLQEAWGVSTFGIEDPTPDLKQPAVQQSVLEKAEASQRSALFVQNFLRDMYQKHGVAGIMGLMDEDVVKELRLAALWSFDWMDTTTLLFIFMCLCGLWLIADILRKG
jgi:hypothetical protein